MPIKDQALPVQQTLGLAREQPVLVQLPFHSLRQESKPKRDQIAPTLPEGLNGGA